MPNITHRPASEADLPRLVEIYNGVIAEGGFTADLVPYTLEQRRGWFDAHRKAPFRIYVVELEGKVAGYFYLSPWRDGRAALKRVGEVSYYLAREARGRGLGNYMLEHGTRIARAGGLRYLLAILLEGNAASRALLEKAGFQLAGLLPEIAELDGSTCGQLIMYRQLDKENA